MAGIEVEFNQEKGLSQRYRRQPVRVRLIAVLFGLLVGCDLLVMAIMLDWPEKIAPSAVELPGLAAQIFSGLKGYFAQGLEAAWIVEPTASPQPSGRQTPGRTFSMPEATQTLPEAGTAAQSPTAFVAQTYTPTATKMALPTASETPLPTAAETATPEPTATAEPLPPPEEQAAPEEGPPDSALVEGVTGYYQSLPLSCESRSAVDWARFFGYEINELEFQYSLPFSDNPETGFVGDPRASAGGTPPYSYGVHAGPVATLLRAYGVAAEDHRWLAYDNLRWEIASGRPVIVWVVGSVWEGSGFAYTASDGQTTTVAALEHTVMIVGYSPEVVIVQDGGGRYPVPVDRFLRSWGALENMAVMVN